jgi:hypothetical protein
MASEGNTHEHRLDKDWWRKTGDNDTTASDKTPLIQPNDKSAPFKFNSLAEIAGIGGRPSTVNSQGEVAGSTSQSSTESPWWKETQHDPTNSKSREQSGSGNWWEKAAELQTSLASGEHRSAPEPHHAGRQPINVERFRHEHPVIATVGDFSTVESGVIGKYVFLLNGKLGKLMGLTLQYSPRKIKAMTQLR